MKKHILIPLLAAGVSQAATLSLTNSNFQASGNNTNPASWSVSETNAGNVSSVYVYGSTSNVLAFWGAGAYAQQSFSTAEATVGSYNSYTVTFDSGWRGFNLPAATSFSVTFSLINVTDNLLIASQTYNFPVPGAAITNTYTPISQGNTVTINYDNTLPSMTGDTIALRISGTGSPDQGANNFANTGWIDNVSITAVPEPSTALLGGLGLLGLLRRRRR